ncbi:hypothetical protein AAHX50_07285 [Klebsiella pneumoniae]
MTTDLTELAQSLKAAAEKLGGAQWQTRKGFSGIEVIVKGSLEKCSGFTSFQPVAADLADTKTARAIALFSPANIIALVEALEKAQRAGSINNQWKPDVCPITGRRFFLWIEHPELGYVPTYGGPYDSYTIPTRDSDGEFSCERYDHDFGGWVDGEMGITRCACGQAGNFRENANSSTNNCREIPETSTNSPAIPEGYVIVPMRLTAENGAKGVLSGEFSETQFVNCPECFGDDECETCDGSGRIEITVPVTWTTIKEIWAKGVGHFSAAPQEGKGE